MNRATAALAVLVLAVGVIHPAGATRPSLADGAFVPDQVLVRFAPGASSDARAAALARVDGRQIRTLHGLAYHLIRLPASSDVARAVEILSDDPAVAVAEPNVTGTIAATVPNDPCVQGCFGARQWNIGSVNAIGGWTQEPGRFYDSQSKIADAVPRIKVAVLDTKIDVTHPEFLNASPLAVNQPWDSANGGQIDVADAIDIISVNRQQGSADYHGTFVAGILAASANNGQGIAGLGYRAEIMPVTVVDGGGVVTGADLADGIMWARARGAKVINLSLGLHQPSSPVSDAINWATAAGAVVVAAAGNNGNDQPFYPAWYNNVVSVSAVDEADRPASCSNHNDHVTVAAPGMGILSADPRTATKYSVVGCGTSTAAPHVSALAALLFLQDPSRTPAQVRSIIERTADDDRYRQGRDDFFGAGRINFERALRDGQGPVVNRVIASVPRALGGVSVVTATGTAVSNRPIRQAEWFLDTLGPAGTGGTVVAADGSFGGTAESLRADIQVPLDFPTGVHRLFVHARDDQGWGASSVGVMIVDRTRPTITSYSVSEAALATAGGVVELRFAATDDYAEHLTYSIKVVSQMTGSVVYQSEPVTFTPGTDTTATWNPGVVARGPHMVELTVQDEALNPTRATKGTLVL